MLHSEEQLFGSIRSHSAEPGSGEEVSALFGSFPGLMIRWLLRGSLCSSLDLEYRDNV